MTPYLVTAPAADPVLAADMKSHLRVDFADDDALIAALQTSAVAMLDGWGGVLGRCIMPQTWAVDVIGPGPHLLPFPDASDVAATSDGEAISMTLERSALGPIVTISEVVPDQPVRISATYGLSSERLPAAQVLIKLIVGNWYENREAAVIGTITSELPMAANALISALRWRRI